jgi:hypothetical protein
VEISYKTQGQEECGFIALRRTMSEQCIAKDMEGRSQLVI